MLIHIHKAILKKTPKLLPAGQFPEDFEGGYYHEYNARTGARSNEN